MKNKNLLIGTIVSLFAVSTLSLAGPHHKRHSGNDGYEREGPNAKMIMKQMAKLDLTKEQHSEIETLIINGIESTKSQRENLKAMQHQLKALMHSESVDETAIKSISLEMANVKSDLMITRLNKRHQIASLLNDEQKEKMEKMKQHRKMKKGRY